MTTLPYPPARNDCQVCRERDADFEVTIEDPVVGDQVSLLCQQCLRPQLAILGGRIAVTLTWAPGRLADHGLTRGGQ